MDRMPPVPPTPAKGTCSALINDVDLLHHGGKFSMARKTDTGRFMVIPLSSVAVIARVRLPPRSNPNPPTRYAAVRALTALRSCAPFRISRPTACLCPAFPSLTTHTLTVHLSSLTVSSFFPLPFSFSRSGPHCFVVSSDGLPDALPSERDVRGVHLAHPGCRPVLPPMLLRRGHVGNFDIILDHLSHILRL